MRSKPPLIRKLSDVDVLIVVALYEGGFRYAEIARAVDVVDESNVMRLLRGERLTMKVSPSHESHLRNRPLRDLFARVQVMPSGCWEWVGYRTLDGYGEWENCGIRERTHQAMLRLIGRTPSSADCVLVCHRCDNPPCVNPDHLYYGTHSQNSIDREQRGRGYMKRRLVSKEQALLAVKLLREGQSLVQISRSVNLDWGVVKKLLDGKTYRHYNLAPTQGASQEKQ